MNYIIHVSNLIRQISSSSVKSDESDDSKQTTNSDISSLSSSSKTLSDDGSLDCRFNRNRMSSNNRMIFYEDSKKMSLLNHKTGEIIKMSNNIRFKQFDVVGRMISHNEYGRHLIDIPENILMSKTLSGTVVEICGGRSFTPEYILVKVTSINSKKLSERHTDIILSIDIGHMSFDPTQIRLETIN